MAPMEEEERMKAMAAAKAKVAQAQEKAKQRASVKQDERPPARAPRAAKVVRLPVWPEVCRGVPNGLLRSALFGAIRKGPRRYLDEEQIAAVDGVEILYTGQRLDQGDLDVWETVLHIARDQAMGKESRFTAYSMLKLLGKTDSGKNRDTLHKRLLRLRANAVQVKQGRFTYIGGLLDEAFKDEETQQYVVVLNPKLRALFEPDQFTQIDWNVRQALDGKPLAQWLHSYYASHAKPFPIGVGTLLKLSGSENDEPRSSRQNLRKALDAVTEASNAHGQAFSYDIAGELVHVEKTPSGTQRRHLAKKAKKAT